ncbi:MAG: SGNH/GDSL hydrolase family protein, partial [Rikenellaceae bacterium]
TNSKNIVIRYTTTSKNYGMPHMPSTGVSGLDLYATDSKGEQLWLAARYTIGDQSTFNYHGITYREGEDGYSYRLFLPPYNGIEKLEIGVDEGAEFSFIEPRKELPIVAYGTSITQGACASRPGMIWTSIVSREMNMPLYNLGFSGNGVLEDALIDLVSDIPAAVYIIDCMPNLQHVEQDLLVDSIVKQVVRLRTLRPETPILLTDHLGYPHSLTMDYYAQRERNAVESQRIAYERLVEMGVTDIYHLDYDTIGLPLDATVEAIHPTDWGMRVYGDAYVEILTRILE